MELFHLSTQETTLCQSLYNLTKEQEYGYDLFITASEDIEQSTLNAQTFDFKKQRYNKHAKQYDYAFIMIDPNEIEKPELFYKKLYAIMKNAGKLIFIEPKREKLGALEEILIASNFVAVNPIEDVFDEYQILSAQKMHGWGD